MEEVNSWNTEGNGKKVWYWIVEIGIDEHGYSESCMTLEYICTIARW